jgi:hypothetical protein
VSLREWVRERRPSGPSTLHARLDEVLEREASALPSDLVEAALRAATTLLENVVARPSAGRECAVDLLTADALTTYAFEAASEAPDQLADRAHAALHHFAALGATRSTEV